MDLPGEAIADRYLLLVASSSSSSSSSSGWTVHSYTILRNLHGCVYCGSPGRFVRFVYPLYSRIVFYYIRV